MKLNELVAIHVGHTTLSPALVKGFLQTSPRYRQWGIRHQLNPASLDQLNATDLFEFYLRQYLTGRHKTPQAVLREVRAFVGHDPRGAYHLINYSLANTRYQLLALEWYELLPRLQTAKKRIVELAPGIDQPTRPLVVGIWGDSQ